MISPSQGIFNFLLYIRPKLIERRKNKKKLRNGGGLNLPKDDDKDSALTELKSQKDRFLIAESNVESDLELDQKSLSSLPENIDNEKNNILLDEQMPDTEK